MLRTGNKYKQETKPRQKVVQTSKSSYKMKQNKVEHMIHQQQNNKNTYQLQCFNSSLTIKIHLLLPSATQMQVFK